MSVKPTKRRIDANPTKEFFISMLVRDIGLMNAIADLVDNSIDGARRLRPKGSFKGLRVRLSINPDRFEIADNCGGISPDAARDYAFRFGRPESVALGLHTIGQFGVGMKRAIFKLGRHFKVESVTSEWRFVIDQDVDEWKNDPSPDWTFTFANLQRNSPPAARDRQGTVLSVTSLHGDISREFELPNFASRLAAQLELAHQSALAAGLVISINGAPLTVYVSELLSSGEIKPAHSRHVYNGRAGVAPVTTDLHAGVGKSDPSAAGWYVYCNGRLILSADQTAVTGWGEDNGKTVPKYHNEFARFRGYAFFDCDDASRLPWNTTKTAVDPDSGLYRSVRLEMIAQMRPVITFLTQLSHERRLTDQGPLTHTIEKARAIDIETISVERLFKAPERLPKPSGPKMGNIAYTRPVEQIERAKRALEVRTYRDVGEATFDYYMENEVED